MDIHKALRELYAEKRRVDAIIKALESGSFSHAARRSRRGRTQMGPEERLEVSRRMRTYWAARRASKNPQLEHFGEDQQTMSAGA